MLDKRLKQCNSLIQLETYYSELSVKIDAIMDNVFFPAPLVDGDEISFWHIGSSSELKEESIVMGHCCYEYMNEILSEDFDFYRFTGQERGTLAIKRKPVPIVFQFLGYNNREMSEKSWEKVSRWLNSSSIKG
jgi:hypothetical protein